MAAANLVGDDTEAFSHYSPQEVGREETVFPAQQEPGRDARPVAKLTGIGDVIDARGGSFNMGYSAVVVTATLGAG